VKTKLHRLWLQMTADKKKFGLMVTVMAIGLLLWGRLILLEKVPRVATADPNAQAAPTSDTPTAPATDSLPPLEVVRVDLSDRLALDLFAFRHDRYRLLPSEDSGEIGIQPGTSDDDEMLRVAEKARGLRLQSVVQGERPLIVINGQVLRVGDSIDGFEIASFDNRSAKVTRGGLTFTLTMMSD